MMRGARGLGFILTFLAMAGFILAWATVPPLPVPYELARWSGSSAGAANSGTMIAQDQATWQAMWRLAHQTVTPMPPAPPFDPANAVGIGIFLGPRPGGSYYPEIVSTAPDRRRFVILAEERIRPGTSSAAYTNAWEILQIRRPDMPVAIQARFLPPPG